MRGRFVSLPPSRRAAIDLLRFSVGVPTVTAVRRMNLSAVAQARAQSAARTRWITPEAGPLPVADAEANPALDPRNTAPPSGSRLGYPRL